MQRGEGADARTRERRGRVREPRPGSYVNHTLVSSGGAPRSFCGRPGHPQGSKIAKNAQNTLKRRSRLIPVTPERFTCSPYALFSFRISRKNRQKRPSTWHESGRLGSCTDLDKARERAKKESICEKKVACSQRFESPVRPRVPPSTVGGFPSVEQSVVAHRTVPPP
eukprot:1048335-Prymnesium_polylepis.1